MAEIKCRQKDMQVGTGADVKLKQQQQPQPEVSANSSHSLALHKGASSTESALNSTTVIKQQKPQQQEALREVLRVENEAANVSSSASGGLALQTFETQIYDLRALTNYTFYVNVLRFVGEQDGQLSALATKPLEQGHADHSSHRHQRPSRRLDLVRKRDNELTTAGQAKFGAMIETTKPFSAEAVKCLAGSSEVLVNTGRYFGGRISVEGQHDSRCQLLGNKSSEQAVYSFHIDHEICHSKTMVSYNLDAVSVHTQ